MNFQQDPSIDRETGSERTRRSTAGERAASQRSQEQTNDVHPLFRSPMETPGNQMHMVQARNANNARNDTNGISSSSQFGHHVTHSPDVPETGLIAPEAPDNLDRLPPSVRNRYHRLSQSTSHSNRQGSAGDNAYRQAMPDTRKSMNEASSRPYSSAMTQSTSHPNLLSSHGRSDRNEPLPAMPSSQAPSRQYDESMSGVQQPPRGASAQTYSSTLPQSSSNPNLMTSVTSESYGRSHAVPNNHVDRQYDDSMPTVRQPTNGASSRPYDSHVLQPNQHQNLPPHGPHAINDHSQAGPNTHMSTDQLTNGQTSHGSDSRPIERRRNLPWETSDGPDPVIAREAPLNDSQPTKLWASHEKGGVLPWSTGGRNHPTVGAASMSGNQRNSMPPNGYYDNIEQQRTNRARSKSPWGRFRSRSRAASQERTEIPPPLPNARSEVMTPESTLQPSASYNRHNETRVMGQDDDTRSRKRRSMSSWSKHSRRSRAGSMERDQQAPPVPNSDHLRRTTASPPTSYRPPSSANANRYMTDSGEFEESDRPRPKSRRMSWKKLTKKSSRANSMDNYDRSAEPPLPTTDQSRHAVTSNGQPYSAEPETYQDTDRGRDKRRSSVWSKFSRRSRGPSMDDRANSYDRSSQHPMPMPGFQSNSARTGGNPARMGDPGSYASGRSEAQARHSQPIMSNQNYALNSHPPVAESDKAEMVRQREGTATAASAGQMGRGGSANDRTRQYDGRDMSSRRSQDLTTSQREYNQNLQNQASGSDMGQGSTFTNDNHPQGLTPGHPSDHGKHHSMVGRHDHSSEMPQYNAGHATTQGMPSGNHSSSAPSGGIAASERKHHSMFGRHNRSSEMPQYNTGHEHDRAGSTPQGMLSGNHSANTPSSGIAASDEAAMTRQQSQNNHTRRVTSGTQGMSNHQTGMTQRGYDEWGNKIQASGAMSNRQSMPMQPTYSPDSQNTNTARICPGEPGYTGPTPIRQSIDQDIDHSGPHPYDEVACQHHRSSSGLSRGASQSSQRPRYSTVDDERDPMPTRDVSGHQTMDQNLSGQNMSRQTTTGGYDTKGHNITGHNMIGLDMTGHNTTGHNTTGHDTMGQSTTGPIGRSLAAENMAGQDSTGQDFTGQNIRGPSMTGQHPSIQKATDRDTVGQHMPGQQMSSHNSTNRSATSRNTTDQQHVADQYNPAQPRISHDDTTQHSLRQNTTTEALRDLNMAYGSGQQSMAESDKAELTRRRYSQGSSGGRSRSRGAQEYSQRPSRDQPPLPSTQNQTLNRDPTPSSHYDGATNDNSVRQSRSYSSQPNQGMPVNRRSVTPTRTTAGPQDYPKLQDYDRNQPSGPIVLEGHQNNRPTTESRMSAPQEHITHPSTDRYPAQRVSSNHYGRDSQRMVSQGMTASDNAELDRTMQNAGEHTDSRLGAGRDVHHSRAANISQQSATSGRSFPQLDTSSSGRQSDVGGTRSNLVASHPGDTPVDDVYNRPRRQSTNRQIDPLAMAQSQQQEQQSTEVPRVMSRPGTQSSMQSTSGPPASKRRTWFSSMFGSDSTLVNRDRSASNAASSTGPASPPLPTTESPRMPPASPTMSNVGSSRLASPSPAASATDTSSRASKPAKRRRSSAPKPPIEAGPAAGDWSQCVSQSIMNVGQQDQLGQEDSRDTAHLDSAAPAQETRASAQETSASAQKVYAPAQEARASFQETSAPVQGSPTAAPETRAAPGETRASVPEVASGQDTPTPIKSTRAPIVRKQVPKRNSAVVPEVKSREDHVSYLQNNDFLGQRPRSIVHSDRGGRSSSGEYDTSKQPSAVTQANNGQERSDYLGTSNTQAGRPSGLRELRLPSMGPTTPLGETIMRDGMGVDSSESSYEQLPQRPAPAAYSQNMQQPQVQQTYGSVPQQAAGYGRSSHTGQAGAQVPQYMQERLTTQHQEAQQPLAQNRTMQDSHGRSGHGFGDARQTPAVAPSAQNLHQQGSSPYGQDDRSLTSKQQLSSSAQQAAQSRGSTSRPMQDRNTFSNESTRQSGAQASMSQSSFDRTAEYVRNNQRNEIGTAVSSDDLSSAEMTPVPHAQTSDYARDRNNSRGQASMSQPSYERFSTPVQTSRELHDVSSSPEPSHQSRSTGHIRNDDTSQPSSSYQPYNYQAAPGTATWEGPMSHTSASPPVAISDDISDAEQDDQPPERYVPWLKSVRSSELPDVLSVYTPPTNSPIVEGPYNPTATANYANSSSYMLRRSSTHLSSTHSPKQSMSPGNRPMSHVPGHDRAPEYTSTNRTGMTSMLPSGMDGQQDARDVRNGSRGTEISRSESAT